MKTWNRHKIFLAAWALLAGMSLTSAQASAVGSGAADEQATTAGNGDSGADDAPGGGDANGPADTGSAQAATRTPSTSEQEEGGQPPARRRQMASPLDQRVALLGKELDLDERQKAEVRKILLQQSEEIRATWGNTTQPAAVRIAASRAIGDKTADRIRAILNDKQREKYIKPRPKVPDHAQAPEKVEGWINAVGSH